jgi:hypothetical protein
MLKQEKPLSSGPWWRHSMMWLVLGGPALVVVASFVTLGLAIHYPDPVLSDKPVVYKSGADGSNGVVLTPAVTARNHAATGGK